MCLLRRELGILGCLERLQCPVGIALDAIRLMYFLSWASLLTIADMTFVAKKLPLDYTLDICSVRWRVRTLEETRKYLSKSQRVGSLVSLLL